MRNGDITSLIVYFGIIIAVCIFIVALEKINKKLNIYFIEIMTETLKEEKNHAYHMDFGYCYGDNVV